MAIAIIEQQTVFNKDLNHRSFSISDFCDSNNIPIGDVLSLESYSTIYELALREWQEIGSIIRSLYLCIIIPFEACTVQYDMLDLAFSHLDGSRTLLSWRSSTNSQQNMNNESFESSAILLIV